MTALSLREPTTKVDAMIDALVLAFRTDPAVRWLYPKSHQYLTFFPDFVQLFGGTAFDADTAYAAENNAGTALWQAPGSYPENQALNTLLQRTVSPDLDTVFALFEAMSNCHPEAPHWYLALLGVEPEQQRRGYGSGLMEPVLRECDCNAQLAYLESSNPDNIPFYERHGFKVMTTIQVNDSPPIFPMVRYPQALQS